ncbi:MAG: hypothetical protein LBH70_10470 [Spirochaetaceae bacterium]|jgi:hypothetical protein|nr:hypothetical protein [Spirochaetaceae bacterium]
MIYRPFSKALRIILAGSLLVFSVAGYSDAQDRTGILTNARDGVFNTEQRLWFSVPDGEWLRLLQDGREAFRGPSPGALVLGVPQGAERDYEIVVERISVPPGERIFETRTFRITVDQKPPDPPVLTLAGAANGSSVLTAKTDDRVRVSALVDVRNTPRYIPDITTMEPLPPASYAAVAWAVDRAGNYSDPAPSYLEFPGFQILNPVPGTWANPQRLILHGAENKEVFWTDDGSDPFDSGGRRYAGPVLIGGTGEVLLRLGIRYADGRVQEEAVSYTVDYIPGEGLSSGSYDEFRRREEASVRTEVSLAVPAGCTWSIGGSPRNPGGTAPVLRPVPLIKRFVPFHVSGGTGTYRFVFALDGTREEAADPLAPERTPREKPREARSLPVIAVSGLVYNNIGEPRLISSGASRVIVWPRNTRVRYQLENNAAWVEGGPPVPVHPAGEILRWVVDRGEEEIGPFYLRIEPVTFTAEREDVYARGRFVYRYLDPEQGVPLGTSSPEAQVWYPGSDLMDYTVEAASLESIDVCDGEDIEWRFITQEGIIRSHWRKDRLSPLPPVLTAPGEGAWVRGPVTLSLASGDGETGASHITARIRYSTGRTEVLNGTDSLTLGGTTNDIAEVRLEAYVEDISGNRSVPVNRNFMIDPSTIYVSAWSREAGTDAGSLSGAERGSRENPHVFLDDALDQAQREQRRLIHLTGFALIRRNIEITGNIEIDGSFDEKWEKPGTKAYIEIPQGVAIRILGSLNLRNIALERMNGANSVFQVRSGGALVLDDSAVSHMGPFLSLENNSSCLIQYTSLLSLISGSEFVPGGARNQRIPVVTASGASCTIRNSRWELEGNYGILGSFRDGNFRAELCNFRMATQTTGTAFIFSGTNVEMTDLTLTVRARDYASALELTRSRLRMTGGHLGVSARDGVAVIMENTDAVYSRTDIAVNSSFVARGMEIRDRFPQVRGCNFVFMGSARSAEVFSAFRSGETRYGTLVPEAGSVRENSFQGFTHILGSRYPMDSLQDFNRAYAPAGGPNVLR